MGGKWMKTRKILLCGVMAVLCFGLIGCSISLSGSAKATADGSGAIIEGAQPIVVQADQPKLPEAPPPPPPPKPTKAKLVGKKIVITEKVMFEYNKAKIKVESNDLLNEVAEIIKKYPSLKKIAVEGHTDADGSDKYNKKLSQKRADAVKKFLVAAGIEEDRLEATGYGEEKPIADNETDEGKEKNRRVEFNILEGVATTTPGQ
jgi:outer membrane protein OmpA-like peptidoglycan-associated protein